MRSTWSGSWCARRTSWPWGTSGTWTRSCRLKSKRYTSTLDLYELRVYMSFIRRRGPSLPSTHKKRRVIVKHLPSKIKINKAKKTQLIPHISTAWFVAMKAIWTMWVVNFFFFFLQPSIFTKLQWAKPLFQWRLKTGAVQTILHSKFESKSEKDVISKLGRRYCGDEILHWQENWTSTTV